MVSKGIWTSHTYCSRGPVYANVTSLEMIVLLHSVFPSLCFVSENVQFIAVKFGVRCMYQESYMELNFADRCFVTNLKDSLYKMLVLACTHFDCCFFSAMVSVF